MLILEHFKINIFDGIVRDVYSLEFGDFRYKRSNFWLTRVEYLTLERVLWYPNNCGRNVSQSAQPIDVDLGLLKMTSLVTLAGPPPLLIPVLHR